MLFHWRVVYDTLRHKASPFAHPDAFESEGIVDSVFKYAKAAAPEVFALESALKAHRTRKIEELALWLAHVCVPLAPAQRQCVVECMLDRLEIGLREAAVGDVGVAHQMPEIAAALHGRLLRYGPLLQANDRIGLETALAEHGIPAERLKAF